MNFSLMPFLRIENFERILASVESFVPFTSLQATLLSANATNL